MPYSHRDAQSNITGLTRWPNGSMEYLEDNNPMVEAFRNPPKTLREKLSPSDKDVAFIAEDILYILLENGTIGAADLDPGVVGALASRRALRGKPE